MRIRFADWYSVPLALFAVVAVLIALRWRAVVAEEGYEAPFGFSVMARATQSAKSPAASPSEKAAGGDTKARGLDPGRQGQPPKATERAAQSLPGKASRAAAPSSPPKPRRLDLNHSSAAELTELPDVGPVLAGRIISYRNEHGPFKTVDELDKVKGVGPKLLEKLRPLLYVSAAPGL